MTTAQIQNQQNLASIAIPLIGSPSSFEPLHDDKWKKLEVNPDTIAHQASDRDELASVFGTYTKDELKFLCEWFGLSAVGTTEEIFERLADHITNNPTDDGVRALLSIIEFIRGRSFTAIERYAGYLLSSNTFDPVEQLDVRQNGKKLYYVMAAYDKSPENLAALMLYSRGERKSFARRELVPDMDEDDDDSNRKKIKSKLAQGISLTSLNEKVINQAVSAYESSKQGREARLYDVYWDARGSNQGDRLAFVLRHRGETSIRQLDDVLFTDEAEFVILRFSDKGRLVQTNPRTKHERRIADAIIRKAIGSDKVRYAPPVDPVTESDLTEFMRKLRKDEDQRLKLTEVHYENAPVEGSPELMLRQDKGDTIADSLSFLSNSTERDFNSVSNIRHVVLSFKSEVGDGTFYKYRVWFNKSEGDDEETTFRLTYLNTRIPSQASREFEQHVSSNYGIAVAPGQRQ